MHAGASISSLDFVGSSAALPPAQLEARRRLVEDLDWPQAFGGPTWKVWQDTAFSGPGIGIGGASGTVNDRRGGKDLPLFWTEVDLRGFRVLSRYMAETNDFAIGFMTFLVGINVRKGFQWQACKLGQKKGAYAGTTQGPQDPLITKAQGILDTFRKNNHWPRTSRECFRRWRRDGEVFLRVGQNRQHGIWCRIIEPEQVGAPDGSTDTPWSYGIDCREYPDGTVDVLDVLAYYVRQMELGGIDGEWIDSKEIVHAKANVDSTVKRGLPDLFPLQDQLDGVRKLLRNMLYTSIDQASVAWRERFPGATAQQVRDLVPSQTIRPGTTVPTSASPYVTDWPNMPFGRGNQVMGKGNKYIPGTIIRTEGDREVDDGPNAVGIPNFIQVLQAVLRGCCVRWNFPEYATGDASNGNFSGILVSGSPLVTTVEGTQLEWGDMFEQPVALRALDRAVDAGQLTPSERAQLDVEVTEPSVVTADPEKETQIRVQKVQGGLLSKTTAMLQDGEDPQHEFQNMANEEKQGQPQQPAPGTPPAGPPPDQGGGLFESVVRENFTGTIKDAAGHERHYVDGKQVKGQEGPADGNKGQASGDQLKAMHKELAAKMPELPEDQFEAMGDYTSGRYVEINQALREGRTATKGAASIPHIAAAIDSAPTLDNPIQVYRGLRLSKVDGDKFIARLDAAKTNGELIQEPGFMSTTINPDVAKTWATGGSGSESPIVFQISARKGLYLGESVGGTKEMELVLQHNSKFKVLGVEDANGHRLVKLEQVL